MVDAISRSLTDLDAQTCKQVKALREQLEALQTEFAEGGALSCLSTRLSELERVVERHKEAVVTIGKVDGHCQQVASMLDILTSSFDRQAQSVNDMIYRLAAVEAGSLTTRFSELERVVAARHKEASIRIGKVDGQCQQVTSNVDRLMSNVDRQAQNVNYMIPRLAAIEARSDRIEERTAEISDSLGARERHLAEAAAGAEKHLRDFLGVALTELEGERTKLESMYGHESKEVTDRAHQAAKAKDAFKTEVAECRRCLERLWSEALSAQQTSASEIRARFDAAVADLDEEIRADLAETRLALQEMIGVWNENLSALQDACVRSLRDSKVSVTCSAQMPSEALGALSVASDLITDKLQHFGGLPAQRKYASPVAKQLLQLGPGPAARLGARRAHSPGPVRAAGRQPRMARSATATSSVGRPACIAAVIPSEPVVRFVPSEFAMRRLSNAVDLRTSPPSNSVGATAPASPSAEMLTPPQRTRQFGVQTSWGAPSTSWS